MTDTPRPSPTHARRPRRGLIVGGGLLLLLAAGIAACEVAGWPFLVTPVERFLSRTLQRDFRLQDAAAAGSDASTLPRASIRFLGGLQLRAPHVFIAAPAWSTEPFFLDARDASLKMGYLDIWRARCPGSPS